MPHFSDVDAKDVLDWFKKADPLRGLPPDFSDLVDEAQVHVAVLETHPALDEHLATLRPDGWQPATPEQAAHVRETEGIVEGLQQQRDGSIAFLRALREQTPAPVDTQEGPVVRTRTYRDRWNRVTTDELDTHGNVVHRSQLSQQDSQAQWDREDRWSDLSASVEEDRREANALGTLAAQIQGRDPETAERYRSEARALRDKAKASQDQLRAEVPREDWSSFGLRVVPEVPEPVQAVVDALKGERVSAAVDGYGALDRKGRHQVAAELDRLGLEREFDDLIRSIERRAGEEA